MKAFAQSYGGGATGRDSARSHGPAMMFTMDDRNAYILNALWTKHYDLGRILRFRHVTRGRQVTAYELLTAEQHEYTAYLYPSHFDAAQLERVGKAQEALSGQSFPVTAPLVGRQESGRTGMVMVGPQGAHLMVSTNPEGQYLLPDQWTLPDLSLLGLRLAWMHSLLAELVPWPTRPVPPTAAAEFHSSLTIWNHDPERQKKLTLNPDQVRHLEHRLEQICTRGGNSRSEKGGHENEAVTGAGSGGKVRGGWVHGDIQPAAILLDHEHHIRTIVDWALLHTGESLEDVVDAFVHWCVATDGTVTDDRGRALLEAYRSLRPIKPGAWADAVTLWLARRWVDFVASRRILPRGYLTYLADPEALSEALQFCDTR